MKETKRSGVRFSSSTCNFIAICMHEKNKQKEGAGIRIRKITGGVDDEMHAPLTKKTKGPKRLNEGEEKTENCKTEIIMGYPFFLMTKI